MVNFELVNAGWDFPESFRKLFNSFIGQILDIMHEEKLKSDPKSP